MPGCHLAALAFQGGRIFFSFYFSFSSPLPDLGQAGQALLSLDLKLSYGNRACRQRVKAGSQQFALPWGFSRWDFLVIPGEAHPAGEEQEGAGEVG